MLTSLVNAERATSHHLELIAAADAARLARRARGAGRTDHRMTTAPRRTWLRAVTQLTHS